MKKGILFLLLISSGLVKAQSLKDALYSGKLKNQPGTVIRKGDDLSTKIDTTTHKPAVEETTATKTTAMAADSSQKKTTDQTDVATTSTTEAANTTAATDSATSETTPATETAAAPKNNTALWKEYVDSAVSSLKNETLLSKKIKKGTYYATVSYTIDTTGQVSIGDVFLSPDNSFLQQQIKDRLNMDAPRLAPVLSSGTPRKITRKYNFTLTKE